MNCFPVSLNSLRLRPWCLLVVLWIICPAVKTGTTSSSELGILVDVLESLQHPASVIASICFSKSEIIHLIKTTSLRGISISIFNIMNNTDLRTSSHEHEIVFLLDIRCEGMLEIILKNESLEILKAPYRWLILTHSCQIKTPIENETFNDETINDNNRLHIVFNKCRGIPPEINQLQILPDSDLTILRNVGLPTPIYALQHVYRPAFNMNWIFEDIGVWSKVSIHQIQNTRNSSVDTLPSLHLFKLANVPLALRRINTKGAPITISYVITNNDTLKHLTDYRHKHIDTITKVNFALTNHVVDLLNGNRSYHFSPTWGYRDPETGAWDGMIGELTEGRADVGGTPAFFTSDRTAVISYIAMSTPTKSKFVFRQPKLSYGNNLFLLPFRREVWICSGSLLVILALALWLVTGWEWRHPNRDPNQMRSESGILRPKPDDVAVLTLGAICQQGSSVELKSFLGRSVIFLMFLALMFLYTSYSANIVALLQSSSSQIRTLEDMLHSRLKFGVDDTIFNHYYFATATEKTRKAIYQTKIAPPGQKSNFMTLQEGVRQIRKGLFAFHMETGVGYDVVGEIFHEGEKCDLEEIQYLQVIDPWLAVQKKSPYKEMFKIGMRRIQEFGLQQRENLRFYSSRPRCDGRGGNFVSVTLVDCYPAFVALLYGTLAAAATLAAETLVKALNLTIHRKQ